MGVWSTGKTHVTRDMLVEVRGQFRGITSLLLSHRLQRMKPGLSLALAGNTFKVNALVLSTLCDERL